MEEKVIEITLSPAKLFALYLNGHGISYKWVADNLDITTAYVSMICNEKASLTNEIRSKMNDLLSTNY